MTKECWWLGWHWQVIKIVKYFVSGKDALISRSGEDNNRPTLEVYLPQLLPRFPRVGMCRWYLDSTTIPKKPFSSLHTAADEPEPDVQEAHLLHAARPQEPPWDDTLWCLFLCAQVCTYPFASAKVIIPCFQTIPHTGSKCSKCSSPESSQVPHIRTHTQVCKQFKKQEQD